MAAAQEIGRLIVRLVGDGKAYQAMLMRAADQTKAFAVRAATLLKTVGASMRSLGRTLAMRVTLPLVIMGGLAVNAFAKFDQAMVQSTSIMQVTTEQMERMRTTALSLSTSGQGAQGATQLAESYFFLASAGKNAEQSMALLPRVMDFATAGAFDMATATDLLTDAQSALGMSVKNVAQDTKNMVQLSDVLVKANTLANASVQQFSTALTSKAAAAMKSFNIPMEEGVAVLAAFADQGIKAELAGNSFSRMMLLMSKASRNNTAAWKRLNFTMFDAVGNVRPMADIVANLEAAIGDLSPELKTAELAALGFDARVQGAILPLLGTSKAIRRYTKELKEAGGTTKDVAEKQMKSFSNQMKVFKNRIAAVGIEIGKTLAPMLAKLSKLIERGLAAWKELSPAVKKALLIFAVIAAVMGPVLIIFGVIVSSVGALIGLIPIVVGLFGALFSTVGLVVAVVAAVVVGIGFLLHKLGLLKPALEGVKKAFVFLVEKGKQLAAITAEAIFGDDTTPNRRFGPTDKEQRAAKDRQRRIDDSKKLVSSTGEFIENLRLASKQYEGMTPKAKSFGAEAKGAQGFLGMMLQPAQDYLTEINKQVAAQRKLNEETQKTAQLAAKLAADAKAEQDAKNKPAEKLLETLLRQRQVEKLGEDAVKLQELKDSGVSPEIISRIENINDQNKRNKERNALLERGKKIIESNLSPLEQFRKKIDELKKLRDIGVFKEAPKAFDIEIQKALEELKELQEAATIQLEILAPRGAAQLGTLEADQRLAEFRNAIQTPALPEGVEQILEDLKPKLPMLGPITSGQRPFVGPNFNPGQASGDEDIFFPQEAQAQNQVSVVLTSIEKLLTTGNVQRDEIIAKDPVEIDEEPL